MVNVPDIALPNASFRDSDGMPVGLDVCFADSIVAGLIRAGPKAIGIQACL